MVKAGYVVQVRVTEIDVPRKRIGLTMRKEGVSPESLAQKVPGQQGKEPRITKIFEQDNACQTRWGYRKFRVFWSRPSRCNEGKMKDIPGGVSA